MESSKSDRGTISERWEFFEVFDVAGAHNSAGWFTVTGRNLGVTNRRELRSRLPAFLAFDHLTAEPAFLEMVDVVRAAGERPETAWTLAARFSPRAGGKGGRRQLMADLLLVAAEAESGTEEAALQSLVAGAWTVIEEEPERSTYRSQDRYMARLFIGARVLVCRATGSCVECDVSGQRGEPVLRGDYCRAHSNNARGTPLAKSRRRHRKATEHLFLELAEAVRPASLR